MAWCSIFWVQKPQSHLKTKSQVISMLRNCKLFQMCLRLWTSWDLLIQMIFSCIASGELPVHAPQAFIGVSMLAPWRFWGANLRCAANWNGKHREVVHVSFEVEILLLHHLYIMCRGDSCVMGFMLEWPNLSFSPGLQTKSPLVPCMLRKTHRCDATPGEVDWDYSHLCSMFPFSVETAQAVEQLNLQVGRKVGSYACSSVVGGGLMGEITSN